MINSVKDSVKLGMEMCGRKESALKELFTVAECPTHPSESLTSDTGETNPALSPFYLPTLTRTTDTCHTLVTWDGRGKENTEKHGPGDKLRQLYMRIFALQDGHHSLNPKRTSGRVC